MVRVATLRTMTDSLLFLAVLASEHAQTITLDSQMLAILTGVLIPIAVGIVTKLDAASGLKAVLNFGLSAVAGALSVVATNNGSMVLKEFVVSIGMTWLISVATYYGLYKPTGVAGSVAMTTSGFGIGRPPTMETDEKGAEDIGTLIGAIESEDADARKHAGQVITPEIDQIMDPPPGAEVFEAGPGPDDDDEMALQRSLISEELAATKAVKKATPKKKAAAKKAAPRKRA